MSIDVTCDACFYNFTVSDRNAGKRGKCPECGSTIAVPKGTKRRSGSATGRRRAATARPEAAAHDTVSRHQKLLIGGGIASGVVILSLVAVVAYLLGKSGDSPEQTPVVAANDHPGDSSSIETKTLSTEPATTKVNSFAPPSRPEIVETSTTESSTRALEPTKKPTNPVPDPDEPRQTQSANGRYASVADLIEAVEPSVCRIDVESSQGSSTGSGFVVDESGLIATNYHVIEGALRANVAFPDKSTARVTGFLHVDAKKDIALLQIELPASPLPVTKLATELPRKGEVLVAIGAPLGLDFSASEGKVAAIRSRDDLLQFGADKNGTWIQSTAAISPGNSGGPLFNMKGEVVAANTMTITKGQNLNFGISADDIRQAIEKKADTLIALSPTSVPVVADSSPTGGRGKPIDGANTMRGSKLLASLVEVQLLVGSFSFDPTGNVEKHVVRLAENKLEQAGLEQKQTNAALMAVFMKFERAGSNRRAKSLVIEAHLVIRDRNDLVTVWKDRENVGSFSESSFIRGNIPSAVRTKVVKFFDGFRTARRKAINESKNASK